MLTFILGRGSLLTLENEVNELKIVLVSIFLMLSTIIVGCDVIDEISDNSDPEPIVVEKTLPEGTLAVHFVDVGQGDATFLDIGETEILIDTGKRGSGIANYIEPYVDEYLDAFIATHPDADHIGEVDVIYDRFDVLYTIDSGDTKTTQTYVRYEDAVSDEETIYKEPKRDDLLVINELHFKVLNPEKGSDDDYNNNSVALYLQYGDIQFIFMGDCEEEVEDEILDEYTFSSFEIDFLKVGHHGSRTSSSPKFMTDISPAYVIYSAGEGNSYGHPHQESIDAWNTIGAEVYGTDIHGTIVVTTEGTVETTKILTEK